MHLGVHGDPRTLLTTEGRWGPAVIAQLVAELVLGPASIGPGSSEVLVIGGRPDF